MNSPRGLQGRADLLMNSYKRCISVCLERLRTSDSKGALSEVCSSLQTFRFMLYDKVKDEATGQCVCVCVVCFFLSGPVCEMTVSCEMSDSYPEV